MLEGILHVCLTRWDTICVICHNSIVHSHQLCFVENAFTYIFKDFYCLKYMLHSLVIAIFNCLSWISGKRDVPFQFFIILAGTGVSRGEISLSSVECLGVALKSLYTGCVVKENTGT
jgi:hypothetical protein